MQYDREKFKRLVHYVISHGGDRDGFGAIKLNKVLWFSDARAFMLTGKPITGARYIREKYGPVPQAIMPVLRQLIAADAIKMWRDRHYGYEQTRFKSLRAPDTRLFSADELKTVDYWIEHIANDHTAGSISDATHDYAWDIARMGEELPYHALFATRVREPSDKERERIKTRIKELGLS
jgi:hypothetical protein